MRKHSRAIFNFFMVWPVLILFIYIYLLPFFQGFYYSLFNWSGYTQKMTYVGVENYIRVFKDKAVWESLYHTLVFFVLMTTITFVVSLFFAVAITRFNLPESGFLRVIFFFPYIMPQVAIGVLWSFIYNPTMGLINSFLKAIGLQNLQHGWLGESGTVIPSIAVTIIWSTVGFFLILFVGSIQSIPASVYEAAAIDGAGEWRQLINITLPLLKETMKTMVLFFVTFAITQTFVYVNVMAGNSNPASEVIGTYMYKQSFTYNNFGYGTAIGTIVCVISVGVVYMLRKLFGKEDIEI